jgi:hypothetical protein
MHAQALIEDVVVGAPIVVIVRRRLVLGHPGAAVMAAIAAAPLAWASVVLILVVFLQVDAEADAACALCPGPFCVLPGPARANSKVLGWTSLKGACFASLWPGNSSGSPGAWFSSWRVMTLSKRANLGLQVQSVVARVNFPHEGNSGLI